MNLARQWTFEPITVEIEPERVATASVDQRVPGVQQGAIRC